MTTRLRSVRRVLAVQDQVKRLAEWHLAAAEFRQRELEGEVRDIDAFIDRSAVVGQMASVALGQRRRLATRAAAAGAEVERQRDTALQAQGLFKIIERMSETLAVDQARLDERRDLERLVDDMLGQPSEPRSSLR